MFRHTMAGFPKTAHQVIMMVNPFSEGVVTGDALIPAGEAPVRLHPSDDVEEVGVDVAQVMSIWPEASPAEAPTLPRGGGEHAPELKCGVDRMGRIVSWNKSKTRQRVGQERCQLLQEAQRRAKEKQPHLQGHLLLAQVGLRFFRLSGDSASDSKWRKMVLKDFGVRMRMAAKQKLGCRPAAPELECCTCCRIPDRPELVFQCHVTTDHLTGRPQDAQLLLGHTVLSLSHESGSEFVIDLSSIEYVELDEFRQLCILHLEAPQPRAVMMSNLSGKMDHFVSMLEYWYRRRTGSSCQGFVAQFSWTWRLRLRARSESVVFAAAVHIVVHEQPTAPAWAAKSSNLHYVLTPMINETSNVTINTRWSTAFFRLKVNTLYLYHSCEDVLPARFWLISQATRVSEVEPRFRPNALRLVLAKQEVLFLSFPCLEEAVAWKVNLDLAKNFRAADLVSWESSRVRTELHVFLALTRHNLYLFDRTFTPSFRTEVDNVKSVELTAGDKASASLTFRACPDQDNADGRMTVWKITMKPSFLMLQFEKLLHTIRTTR